MRYYALFLTQAVLLAAPNETVPYETRTWDAATLGNQRVVLKLAEKADAVWVDIPWRRRDAAPEKNNLILIEESTGQRVTNLLRVAVSAA